VSDQSGDAVLTDRAAREAFVEAAYVGLYRWLLRLVRSPDLAADLTQESFVEFWKSLDRRPQGVDARAWLYAIGRNRWRKAARDRRALVSLAASPLPAGGRSHSDSIVDREFRVAAEAAIAELPDDLGEAFTLRFWHGFDYEDIGLIQGVTPGLARWRYFAARRRLHERLAAWDPQPCKTREDRHAR
jgi:RNA polymerase sigma-70 factor (ECF subfamily)